MTKHIELSEKLKSEFSDHILSNQVSFDEVTIECETGKLINLLTQLRDHKTFEFDQLIDICAVDYLKYGVYDWETEQASESGFSRGVERQAEKAWSVDKPRFAVVYHLLSTTKNTHDFELKFMLKKHMRLSLQRMRYGKLRTGLSVKLMIFMVFYSKDTLISEGY